MIRRILILLFVLISVPTFASIGQNNKFWIISQNDFNSRISKGQDVVLRRYIVMPGIDKKYKDIFDTKDGKAVLAKFSFLLKKNKSTWIKKYINNGDTLLDINNLIKGLYYFSKNQYAQAIVRLEKLDNDEYTFLKLLLIADCKYELLQNKHNYKSIIEYYQIAMDCTNNGQNKSIINKRIKYIKYH